MMQPQSTFRPQYLPVFVLLFALLAACTPVIRPSDAQSAPPAENMAVANVRQVLMQQLHADVTAIEVLDVTAEQWSDACLGAGRANELCAQMTTPGYRITLAVNGAEYRYHTNDDGSNFRLVEAPTPAIGERILTWTGNDEAGCQTIEAGVEGVAYAPCFGTFLGVPYSLETRQPDLIAFADLYQSFTADTPAGAVEFVGNGDTVATPVEQRMIAEWARLVSLEAQGGRSGASWGLAFAWHREGGIAGFCDDVTVYRTGEAYLTSCKGNQPQDLGRLRLDAEQLATVYAWVDTLQPFELEQTDPAKADAMTIRIVFSGGGSAAATEADQQAITDFAQGLLAQVTDGATTPNDAAPSDPGNTITGEAIVESIEVRILESDPVQIEAVVRGFLPDACTTLADSSVGLAGNSYQITLTTSRPADRMCAQMVTRFEQVVKLGSPEPATGAYEVRAGAVVESFTLGQ